MLLKVKSGEALSHFENFLEVVLRLKASQKVKSKFDFCLMLGRPEVGLAFCHWQLLLSLQLAYPGLLKCTLVGCLFVQAGLAYFAQAGVHVLD